MLRMILRPGPALCAILALGALTAGGAMEALNAQDVRARVRVERDECRCVDRDGKPIENCTCFTLPDVDRIVTRAMAGVVTRPRLGITLGGEGGEGVEGARIASVMEDGPADEAGLREGDVIVRLDGKSLLEPLDPELEPKGADAGSRPTDRLMALVRRIEPGQEVAVEYLRDGARARATVKARELDSWSFAFTGPDEVEIEELRDRMRDLRTHTEELRLRAPGAPGEIRIWSDSAGGPWTLLREGPDARAFFVRPGGDGILRSCPEEEGRGARTLALISGCVGGLRMVELNPGLAEYFGTTGGVLVADVHERSKLGLRPGDVLLAVGDRTVDGPDRARRVLESYGPDEKVTLRIMREKRELTVEGTLGG